MVKKFQDGLEVNSFKFYNFKSKLQGETTEEVSEGKVITGLPFTNMILELNEYDVWLWIRGDQNYLYNHEELYFGNVSSLSIKEIANPREYNLDEINPFIEGICDGKLREMSSIKLHFVIDMSQAQ